MFATRLPSFFLASLLAVGAFFVDVSDAHASARVLGARVQQAHAQAARSTDYASRELSRYDALSRQFYRAMQSPNAAYRAQAKRVALQWLSSMRGLLQRAAYDHRATVNALNTYLRYVGRNPQAENLRYQLMAAERRIWAHDAALVRDIDRVRRMY